MTVTSKARSCWLRAAATFALAVTMAAFAAGETRSQQYTLDQLSRVGGNVDAGDFPLVLGGRTVRAKFYQKHSFTIADGSRHTMFVFRSTNCWLRERTATARAAIDCRGRDERAIDHPLGPGVFIPVLFVTPASRSRSGRASPPELIMRSTNTSSFADYTPYGDARGVWVRLQNPEQDSLKLSAPAAPAALVVCVPFSDADCGNAGVMLTNLDDTPPDQAPPPQAAPVAPPRTAATVNPPSPPNPSTPPAPPTPPPPVREAPVAPPSATTGEAPPPGQLHYIIRPAANATLSGWTPARMAKRLLALVTATGSEFLVQTSGGSEVRSSIQPELTRSGDGIVAWSGDRPEGPAKLVVRGVDGLEVDPQTQSSEPQATPAALIDTRVRHDSFVSFAEFRIATPFLYDQWQARIEAVTKVYGREQPDSADDLCQFAVLIPRTGWLSFLTGPIGVGLERMDEGGKRILQSAPAIMPAQLIGAAGEPLHLDVQPTAADQSCISQTKRLAPFTTASGNATAAWKLSELPGNPSTGRMEIHPSSLATRGRWLLGLYGPQNIGAGAEAGTAAEAKDQILSSLTTFLDEFRERNFQRGRPESQAIGADLALIGSADAGSTTFSERTVIIGKFRQPPPSSDLFQPDQEAKRRLSAFQSDAGNVGSDVSFRSVGQTVRHYSQLFGEFSGQKPPIAVYVGTARPGSDSCVEWKKMTADVSHLSGRPRVLAIVFANAGAEQISRQLGQNSRGADEVLAPGIRSLTCEGDSGSSLLFVPFPDLLSHPPETVLRPAFNVLDRWAEKLQNWP